MNEEQDNKSKTEKKYETVMKKLTAILSGENRLKPVKKLPQDQLSNLVEELFKEESDALFVEVKSKLKDLLKQYHEMEKALKQKREELEKLGISKKEEFIKAANSLFDKVTGVDGIQQSYYQGLKAVVENSEKDTSPDQENSVE